jgi:hypothetical protein
MAAVHVFSHSAFELFDERPVRGNPPAADALAQIPRLITVKQRFINRYHPQPLLTDYFVGIRWFRQARDFVNQFKSVLVSIAIKAISYEMAGRKQHGVG